MSSSVMQFLHWLQFIISICPNVPLTKLEYEETGQGNGKELMEETVKAFMKETGKKL